MQSVSILRFNLHKLDKFMKYDSYKIISSRI